MLCFYCNLNVADEDDYLECDECECVVHAACLRTCRPGDLLGDIYFDFTCADCMNLQYNMPSTSASAKMLPARETFVRQRLSWFMIVVLTLYNLSIKSKGLSHHGFFHWRSHIVNFINKNWEFIMEPGTRRRKNWFGSISGNLSHYSPEFFLSGQETIQKSGWWRLAETNLTPKMIQKKYEQFCQKRSQMRSDKRPLEDSNNTGDQQLGKRRRQLYSDDELLPLVDGCSRTIPYMGRSPKIANKQLNIIDDDIQQKPPLNTVQSGLMDFLAENLDNYDLFDNLPNIASETLVGHDEKSDFLPLLDTHQNDDIVDIFGSSDGESRFKNNGKVNTSNFATLIDDKFKSFTNNESEKQQNHYSSLNGSELDPEDAIQTLADDNNYTEDDEFKPRIVQVTNFQELKQLPNKDQPSAEEQQAFLAQLEQNIKKEVETDEEQIDNEEIGVKCKNMQNNDTIENEAEDSKRLFSICKPSLFTKVPRRKWPWLEEDEEREAKDKGIYSQTTESKPHEQGAKLTMMSEYEEIELLQKLKKIFALEDKYKLDIPPFVRRFYRKLCIRDWKRERGIPQFNLDDQINGKVEDKTQEQIIDRYQLITDSTSKKYKTFYARIAGSFEYEMFESPYSHRILHPFVFRDEEIAPPWLTVMCELQFKVNGKYPTRSTIDFCYVRPNHIAAVNALLQTTFWPGIDMSECLSYPDYSVVALYKKLVVGCGFLVPDVGFNEAYISFMAVRPNWQRCGIGTFMLYHLIQTCMTKDITLHVSASNPAIVLYQKFGFKIEEIIHDFYDKYLPIHSKDSRTAFFLRLLRS